MNHPIDTQMLDGFQVGQDGSDKAPQAASVFMDICNQLNTSTHDSTPNDNDSELFSRSPSPVPNITSITTRTHSRSSSTSLPVSVVVSRKPDWEKNFPDLISELNTLRAELHKKDTNLRKEAELGVANAHCTIIQRALNDANVRVENLTKKKTRASGKTKACFGTLPELKAAFDVEDAEHHEREHLDAKKRAQKQAETAAQNARITIDMTSKTFDNPLSFYK